MSLFRQVWIMIISSALLAFLVALYVSTYSARDYLQTQLYVQSNDTASALALSLSQHANDPAMQELMVSALFDSGHFELITIKNNSGKIVNQLRNKELPLKVPSWFIQAFPIEVQPGQALITSGWQQAGKVEIRAHSRFAYESLWEGARKLLFWMTLGGMVTGFLMQFVLKRVRQPMLKIMEQAAAIKNRQFLLMPKPAYIELEPVADAMNSMVQQVKTMFDDQSERIKLLKEEATRDPITRLANRSFFLGRFDTQLNDEDSPAEGALFLFRIHDLSRLNRDLGREHIDNLLVQIAKQLSAHASQDEFRLCARLNGSDFALTIPDLDDEDLFAELLLKELLALYPESSNFLHLGYSMYARGETLSAVLSRADTALAQAEASVVSTYCGAELSHTKSSKPNLHWRERLLAAIEKEQFIPALFGSVDWHGNTIHQEIKLRLPDEQTGEVLSSGLFMPFAVRLGLQSAIDLLAVKLALNMLMSTTEDRAVNLAASSISNSGFRRDLSSMLRTSNSRILSRLWIEINEEGLGNDLSELTLFAQEMRELKIKVGIKHFGRQFDNMPKLYDLAIAYLKIDGSLIHDIHHQTGNQELIRAIVNITNNLDILTIAEQVSSEAEWQQLKLLGLSGASGPITSHKYLPQ